MPARRRVLILGGSTEASELARRLADLDRDDVTVSYAGRTTNRTVTPGQVRVGGFGGASGLADYLVRERVDVVVDATHPFAARMPHHAARACATTGVARLRVWRSPWEPIEGDRWHDALDLDAAAALLGEVGARRVFLTTGRQELVPFASVRHVWFLIRAIEAPETVPFAHASVVLARGPFNEREELELLRAHQIDVLVTKNSGGSAAAAKLAAARTLELPVVMVRRPAPPGGPRASSVEEALRWLDLLGGPTVRTGQDPPGYARGV
jgi:precorrin-6A/cobalt-precorrin-6A reductase